MAYSLTRRAAESIVEAYLFGVERFGTVQAEHYRESLENCFDILSRNPRIARERNEFRPPVRVHHHGSHYVVYRIEPLEDILILAVLHDAMDLAQHL